MKYQYKEYLKVFAVCFVIFILLLFSVLMILDVRRESKRRQAIYACETIEQSQEVIPLDIIEGCDKLTRVAVNEKYEKIRKVSSGE